MDKLLSLKIFALVCKRHSFAGAARELGLSAAAVSKHIAQLEDFLGLQLIIRSTRSMKLSDEGVAYLAEVQKIFAAVDSSEALLSGFKAEPQGELRIICGRYFADNYVLPVMAQFLRDFSQVQMSLELAERVPNIIEEDIDLQIGYSISGAADTVQKQITKTRYVLCASVDYIANSPAIKKVQDLGEHAYISHSMRQPPGLVKFSGDQQIMLQPRILVNDAQSMLHLALMDLGIIWVHEYIVKEALVQGRLLEILKSHASAPVALYAGYKHKLASQAKLRIFLERIITLL